jgi:hypothetical protein
MSWRAGPTLLEFRLLVSRLDIGAMTDLLGELQSAVGATYTVAHGMTYRF